MERTSWELARRFVKRRPTRVFALRSTAAWLPLFLCNCGFHIIFGALRHRISILYLGDCVLAPLGALAKLFRIPVCVTIHGRDITYPNLFYRLWLALFLRDFDTYICVSVATRDAAIGRGVPAARAVVIGNGVTAPTTASAAREPDLLLFIGRLVPRKGLTWFVQAVLPRIVQWRPNVRLAIVGAGPERAAIRSAASASGVGDRIEWLGLLPEASKEQWLRRATICIAPNLNEPGDIEGYGISALEGAAAGCAVVAANLEGLRDAIVDGEGGRLVAAGDAEAWTTTIVDLLSNRDLSTQLGDRARSWARLCRSWDSVCDRYETAFDALMRLPPLADPTRSIAPSVAGSVERCGFLRDPEGRVIRGRRIVTALREFGGPDPNNGRLLDIGCSAGLMTMEIAKQVSFVVGIDVDPDAVRYAASESKKHSRPHFLIANGTKLPFADESFHAVVCNHVYEHVKDPRSLTREIHRVLQRGGVCYFAAGHTLQLIEPHHGLPLLSWLPRPMADAWVRATGRGLRYEEKFVAPWRMRSLFDDFTSATLVSPAMLREPERYGVAALTRLPSAVRFGVAALAQPLARLAPTWIWMLRR